MTQQAKVFLSSTCFDLADARREIRSYLEENQFLVSLSEDPHSAFFIDPLDDSIGTCLKNVESSDAVICLVDRRYGGVLKEAPYKGVSATHAEVRCAWGSGIPVLTFIRSAAWREYEQLKGNTGFQPKWVEVGRPEVQRAWFDFVTEIVEHKPATGRSNFRDLFDFSTDLKALVLKRLVEQFPEHAGTLAMRPDRLVRLHFVFSGSHREGMVHGHFRNVGIGPAMNIFHGVRVGDADVLISSRGAVGEKESINGPNGKEFGYQLKPGTSPVIFCEYENRFGDCYRVEQPFFMSEHGFEPSGSDTFSVVPPHLTLRSKDGNQPTRRP